MKQSFAKSITLLTYACIAILMFSTLIENVISCEMETARNCSYTSDLWNAAAMRKNCSTNICGSKSVYHCLLTETGQLVEVCAAPINLNGVCPYFDTVGKLIQRSKTSCVSTDSTKKCTNLYSSANVHDYPVCYPSKGNTDDSSSGATRTQLDATRYRIFFIIKCIFVFKIVRKLEIMDFYV